MLQPRFVNPKLPECAICLHTPIGPSGCGNNCAALFCQDCLTKSLVLSKSCPCCKGKVDDNKPRRNMAMQKFLSGQMVFCIHSKDESNVVQSPNKRQKSDQPSACCDFLGAWDNLPWHLTHECLFVDESCSFGGCTHICRRGLMLMHQSECSFRPMKCQHCLQLYPFQEESKHMEVCEEGQIVCELCSESMKRKEKKSHDEQHCPEANLRCIFGDHGCQAHYLRKDEQAHHAEYAMRHCAMMASFTSEMAKEIFFLKRQLQEERSSPTFFWTIHNVNRSMISQTQPSSPVQSPLFSVHTHSDGILHLRMQIRFNGKAMSFFLQNATLTSLNVAHSFSLKDCMVQIGWGAEKGATLNFKETDILKSGTLLGYHNVIHDVSPCLVRGKITISFHCKNNRPHCFLQT